MMQVIVGGVAVIALLTYALIFQSGRLGKTQELYEAAKVEAKDAKAQTEALTRATREHAQQLAAARRQAANASRVVAAIPSDDCLERRLPDAALDVLRMHDDKDGASAPAPAGGRKADAKISR